MFFSEKFNNEQTKLDGTDRSEWEPRVSAIFLLRFRTTLHLFREILITGDMFCVEQLAYWVAAGNFPNKVFIFVHNLLLEETGN